MRPSAAASFLTTVVQLAVLSLALPLTSPLALRRDLSSVAPSILPKYTPGRRTPPTPGLRPRDLRETSLCIPNTLTCVSVSIAAPSAPSIQHAILALLSQALMAVHVRVEAHGDGAVTGGEAKWVGDGGVALRVVNADNHQVTWGVLGGAIQGVMAVMAGGKCGRAGFVVLDGGREVGRGWVDA